MATTETRPSHNLGRGPRKPDFGSLERATSGTVRYFKSVDTLFIHFGDPKTPAVVWFVDGNLSFLLSPDDNKVVGVAYDHYLSEAVHAHIELQGIAKRLVLHERIERLRKPTEKSIDIAAFVRSIADMLGVGFGNNHSPSNLRLA